MGERGVAQRRVALHQPAERLLDEARLGWDANTRPEVYVVARESWTDLVARYLVPAREMRKWSTRLQLAANEAFGAAEVAGRVFPAYVRRQVQPLPAPAWTREPEGPPESPSDRA